MPPGFATNWLSVRTGLLACAGRGSYLAVVQRPRLSPGRAADGRQADAATARPRCFITGVVSAAPCGSPAAW